MFFIYINGYRKICHDFFDNSYKNVALDLIVRIACVSSVTDLNCKHEKKTALIVVVEIIFITIAVAELSPMLPVSMP